MKSKLQKQEESYNMASSGFLKNNKKYSEDKKKTLSLIDFQITLVISSPV